MSCEKVAGIRIHSTRNLLDHLKMTDEDQTVYVFHHAAFLDLHQQISSETFPAGFLEETISTLSLLLPRNHRRVQAWYRRKASELGLDASAKPRTLAQWWNLSVVANMSMKAHRSSLRRSRSPLNPQTSPSHRHRRQRSSSPRPRDAPIILPLHAHAIRKRDFETYKPLFGLYLDIQKQLILEDLDERELTAVRNRGELAEGWYDPETLRKAQASVAAADGDDEDNGRLYLLRAPVPAARAMVGKSDRHGDDDDDDDEDDSYGPALPSSTDLQIRSEGKREKPPGPSIPGFQDLQERRELAAETKDKERTHLHHARRADVAFQKAALEDLAPRAAPGTKDRQLERKADLRASNAAFAASKTDANTTLDVPEAELMGDDEEGIGGFKKKKTEEERRKNEREVRREEILRARKEEREERIRAYREKEVKTMEGLVALARARFG
ncbi:MAG: hypothetical protein Q9207_004179 [Kuettlingeria erythrocarpa]